MTLPVCNVCGRPPFGIQPDGSVRYTIRNHPPIIVREGFAGCQRRKVTRNGSDQFEWCPGQVEIVEGRMPLPV